MWKIHYEHISSVNKTGRKNNRSIFDPLLLIEAIALLTKTFHSIYKEIAQAMQLPSLSYVLRKKGNGWCSECFKRSWS